MSTTTIKNRQIADQAIDDAKVKSGAGIQTSKLAEGAEFFKRDGSVPATGNFDLGNNRLTNLGTPSAGTDAVNKSYTDGLVAGLSSVYKYRNVRFATTTNVNISSPGSTFDSGTANNGDRLLLRVQDTASQNGIYDFNGPGSPLTRSSDSDAWDELTGSLVSVNEGTTYADTRWYCPVNDGGTLGTTAITYTQDQTNPLSAANFVDKEVPSGTINGVNTTFTIANTPVSGSEHIYLNGLLQRSGAGNDYTISGTTITMLDAPLSGDVIVVSYRK